MKKRKLFFLPFLHRKNNFCAFSTKTNEKNEINKNNINNNTLSSSNPNLQHLLMELTRTDSHYNSIIENNHKNKNKNFLETLLLKKRLADKKKENNNNILIKKEEIISKKENYKNEKWFYAFQLFSQSVINPKNENNNNNNKTLPTIQHINLLFFILFHNSENHNFNLFSQVERIEQYYNSIVEKMKHTLQNLENNNKNKNNKKEMEKIIFYLNHYLKPNAQYFYYLMHAAVLKLKHKNNQNKLNLLQCFHYFLQVEKNDIYVNDTFLFLLFSAVDYFSNKNLEKIMFNKTQILENYKIINENNNISVLTFVKNVYETYKNNIKNLETLFIFLHLIQNNNHLILSVFDTFEEFIFPSFFKQLENNNHHNFLAPTENNNNNNNNNEIITQHLLKVETIFRENFLILENNNHHIKLIMNTMKIIVTAATNEGKYKTIFSIFEKFKFLYFQNNNTIKIEFLQFLFEQYILTLRKVKQYNTILFLYENDFINQNKNNNNNNNNIHFLFWNSKTLLYVSQAAMSAQNLTILFHLFENDNIKNNKNFNNNNLIGKAIRQQVEKYIVLQNNNNNNIKNKIKLENMLQEKIEKKITELSLNEEIFSNVFKMIQIEIIKQNSEKNENKNKKNWEFFSQNLYNKYILSVFEDFNDFIEIKKIKEQINNNNNENNFRYLSFFSFSPSHSKLIELLLEIIINNENHHKIITEAIHYYENELRNKNNISFLLLCDIFKNYALKNNNNNPFFVSALLKDDYFYKNYHFNNTKTKNNEISLFDTIFEKMKKIIIKYENESILQQSIKITEFMNTISAKYILMISLSENKKNKNNYFQTLKLIDQYFLKFHIMSKLFLEQNNFMFHLKKESEKFFISHFIQKENELNEIIQKNLEIPMDESFTVKIEKKTVQKLKSYENFQKILEYYNKNDSFLNEMEKNSVFIINNAAEIINLFLNENNNNNLEAKLLLLSSQISFLIQKYFSKNNNNNNLEMKINETKFKMILFSVLNTVLESFSFYNENNNNINFIIFDFILNFMETPFLNNNNKNNNLFLVEIKEETISHIYYYLKHIFSNNNNNITFILNKMIEKWLFKYYKNNNFELFLSAQFSENNNNNLKIKSIENLLFFSTKILCHLKERKTVLLWNENYIKYISNFYLKNNNNNNFFIFKNEKSFIDVQIMMLQCLSSAPHKEILLNHNNNNNNLFLNILLPMFENLIFIYHHNHNFMILDHIIAVKDKLRKSFHFLMIHETLNLINNENKNNNNNNFLMLEKSVTKFLSFSINEIIHKNKNNNNNKNLNHLFYKLMNINWDCLYSYFIMQIYFNKKNNKNKINKKILHFGFLLIQNEILLFDENQKNSFQKHFIQFCILNLFYYVEKYKNKNNNNYHLIFSLFCNDILSLFDNNNKYFYDCLESVLNVVEILETKKENKNNNNNNFIISLFDENCHYYSFFQNNNNFNSEIILNILKNAAQFFYFTFLLENNHNFMISSEQILKILSWEIFQNKNKKNHFYLNILEIIVKNNNTANNVLFFDHLFDMILSQNRKNKNKINNNHLIILNSFYLMNILLEKVKLNSKLLLKGFLCVLNEYYFSFYNENNKNNNNFYFQRMKEQLLFLFSYKSEIFDGLFLFSAKISKEEKIILDLLMNETLKNNKNNKFIKNIIRYFYRSDGNFLGNENLKNYFFNEKNEKKVLEKSNAEFLQFFSIFTNFPKNNQNERKNILIKQLSIFPSFSNEILCILKNNSKNNISKEEINIILQYSNKNKNELKKMEKNENEMIKKEAEIILFNYLKDENNNNNNSFYDLVELFLNNYNTINEESLMKKIKEEFTNENNNNNYNNTIKHNIKEYLFQQTETHIRREINNFLNNNNNNKNNKIILLLLLLELHHFEKGVSLYILTDYYGTIFFHENNKNNNKIKLKQKFIVSFVEPILLFFQNNNNNNKILLWKITLQKNLLLDNNNNNILLHYSDLCKTIINNENKNNNNLILSNFFQLSALINNYRDIYFHLKNNKKNENIFKFSVLLLLSVDKINILNHSILFEIVNEKEKINFLQLLFLCLEEQSKKDTKFQNTNKITLFLNICEFWKNNNNNNLIKELNDIKYYFVGHNNWKDTKIINKIKIIMNEKIHPKNNIYISLKYIIKTKPKHFRSFLEYEKNKNNKNKNKIGSEISFHLNQIEQFLKFSYPKNKNNKNINLILVKLFFLKLKYIPHGKHFINPIWSEIFIYNNNNNKNENNKSIFSHWRSALRLLFFSLSTLNKNKKNYKNKINYNNFTECTSVQHYMMFLLLKRIREELFLFHNKKQFSKGIEFFSISIDQNKNNPQSFYSFLKQKKIVNENNNHNMEMKGLPALTFYLWETIILNNNNINFNNFPSQKILTEFIRSSIIKPKKNENNNNKNNVLSHFSYYLYCQLFQIQHKIILYKKLEGVNVFLSLLRNYKYNKNEYYILKIMIDVCFYANPFLSAEAASIAYQNENNKNHKIIISPTEELVLWKQHNKSFLKNNNTIKLTPNNISLVWNTFVEICRTKNTNNHNNLIQKENALSVLHVYKVNRLIDELEGDMLTIIYSI